MRLGEERGALFEYRGQERNLRKCGVKYLLPSSLLSAKENSPREGHRESDPKPLQTLPLSPTSLRHFTNRSSHSGPGMPANFQLLNGCR